MTKREAAIVSLYTGHLIGQFKDLHEYVCELIEKKYVEQNAFVEFHHIFNDEAEEDFKALKVE